MTQDPDRPGHYFVEAQNTWSQHGFIVSLKLTAHPSHAAADAFEIFHPDQLMDLFDRPDRARRLARATADEQATTVLADRPPEPGYSG